MNQKITLVVPEAPPPAPGARAAPRGIDRNRFRLGVLDNSKGNADHLLAMVVEGVRAALPVASVVSRRKNAVSLPAPDTILDELTTGADLVVSAMAD